MTAILKSALEKFETVDGLVMAAVVTSDGIPVESVTKSEDLDVEAVAVVASTAFQMAKAFGGAIGTGDAQGVILEFDEGLAVLTPVGDEAFLVGISKTRSDLGRIRYVAAKHREEIMKALEEL
jgi:uncharacterized protein